MPTITQVLDVDNLFTALLKDNGKTHPLSIPAVRDRILQTATTRVLTPIFEKEFEKYSYAYRKGFL